MELINSLPVVEKVRLLELFDGEPSDALEMEEYLTEQGF